MSLIPPHAISIWVEGKTVCLAYEGTKQAGPRVVRLPATSRGLILTIELLRDREREGVTTIGNRSAPVQYDIDHTLKSSLDQILKVWRGEITYVPSKRRGAKPEPETLDLTELGLV